MAAISVQEDGGGDYTTLEAAVENASTGDGDVITISETWSASENTQIAVTDAITILCTGASKHIGRPHSGSETTFRHRNSSSGHSFTITDTGTVVFEDIDIQNASTGTSDEVFRNNISNTFIARRCVLGFASRNSQQDVYYNEAQLDVTFESCHFYNAQRAVVDAQAHDTGSVVNINSCTAYDVGNGVGGPGTRGGLVGINGSNTIEVNVFNTICDVNGGNPIRIDSTTGKTINCHTLITNSADVLNLGTLNTDTNNVTSATINDTDSSGNYILLDTTTSPFDLRLLDSANNAAQDNFSSGTGTGTGLTVPSTDIVGTSRPQNTDFDVGAFEIVSGATTALTGTATAAIDEDDITTGGKTIIITLTGDTFKAAGTGPIGSTADTQALIDGFDAASSPTNGWNNEVRDKALTSEIARTSSTVATWTVAAQAGYDISSQETITGTIPIAVLVTGAGAITATPTFTIDEVVSGRIMGSLAHDGGLAGMGGLAGRGGGLAG